MVASLKESISINNSDDEWPETRKKHISVVSLNQSATCWLMLGNFLDQAVEMIIHDLITFLLNLWILNLFCLSSIARHSFVMINFEIISRDGPHWGTWLNTFWLARWNLKTWRDSNLWPLDHQIIMVTQSVLILLQLGMYFYAGFSQVEMRLLKEPD